MRSFWSYHCSWVGWGLVRWKYEVNCIDEEPKYSASTVKEAVRKSLKSPAADVLCKLGINPSVDQVVNKLQSLYGSVLSGPAILERFYKEQQGDVSCAKWSITLENWIYQAAEKKAIPVSSISLTLKHKFWSGLEDKNIKNALRNRYEDVEFEQLVAESRAIEEENAAPQKSKVKSQQITESENSKLDAILKKMERMEADIKHLKEERKEKQAAPPVSRKEPVRCTKCHLEGHLFYGCKKGEDVICHRCNSKGHLAHACRNRKVLN